MHRRRWTDPRDDREWTITHNPAVELARPAERAMRSRMIFESEGERFDAEAVFGRGLQDLTDDDLQGLLDQARRARGTDEGEARDRSSAEGGRDADDPV